MLGDSCCKWIEVEDYFKNQNVTLLLLSFKKAVTFSFSLEGEKFMDKFSIQFYK